MKSLLSTNYFVEGHLNYLSEYSKTLRMITWIFQFIHNTKNFETKGKEELYVEEIAKYGRLIWKIVQQNCVFGKGGSKDS